MMSPNYHRHELGMFLPQHSEGYHDVTTWLDYILFIQSTTNIGIAGKVFGKCDYIS